MARDGGLEPLVVLIPERFTPASRLDPKRFRVVRLRRGNGELGLEMRAPTFVTKQRPLGDHAGKYNHIAQGAGKAEVLVGPIGPVGKVYALVALLDFFDRLDRDAKVFVVSHDGDPAGHAVAQFAMKLVGVLFALIVDELIHPLLVRIDRRIEKRRGLILGAAAW